MNPMLPSNPGHFGNGGFNQFGGGPNFPHGHPIPVDPADTMDNARATYDKIHTQILIADNNLTMKRRTVYNPHWDSGVFMSPNNNKLLQLSMGEDRLLYRCDDGQLRRFYNCNAQGKVKYLHGHPEYKYSYKDQVIKPNIYVRAHLRRSLMRRFPNLQLTNYDEGLILD